MGTTPPDPRTAPTALARTATFRERVRRGERLIGTFAKTPHPAVVEVLGLSPLDCLCLDAEHAPFDRGDLDVALLAARAADLPTLVRVPHGDAAQILNALDCGATGVVVPHVASAADARAAAAACRYGRGGRGYAGSTRAAGYGTRKMGEIIPGANATVTLVAQIEDAEALDEIDAIAAVDGIDCLFVGRMDLTVSLGAATPNDPVVVEAVRRICAAGRAHGRAVGMFTPTTEEAAQWCEAGASLFLLGADQGWILQGARELATRFRAL
ncbi:MAG: HpcH/HpaI aldolase family protein [Pseudomonadota bacterium]